MSPPLPVLLVLASWVPQDAALLAAEAGAPRPQEGSAAAAGVAPAEDPQALAVPAPRQPLDVLTKTGESVLEALFQARPWLAYERGWPAPPAGLGRYDPNAQASWDFALDTATAELAALRPAVLEPGPRADRAWLASWVLTESTLSFSRASHRWNPAGYVERAQRVLAALGDTAGLAPAERQERALAVLEELPLLWEAARRGLLSPSSELSAEAIQRLLDLGLFLERELPPLLADAPWTGPKRKRLAELVEEALRQSLRFRTWLAERPLRTGGPVPPMGVGSWEKVVRELTGTPLDAAQLKSKLLREVSSCDRRLGARRSLPEPEPEELSSEAVELHVREASRFAMALALEAGLFEGALLPWKELQIDARVVRGATLPGPMARTWPAPRGHRLILEVAGPTWTPAQKATRHTFFHEPALRALAVRHGMPGEALLRLAAGRNSSPIERYLWNRAAIEGWGLYLMDLTARISWVENPLRRDEAYQAEVARVLLVEAARFLASLEIHAQEIPLEDAAESFARRSGFDELSAFYEARRALADPLYGIGFVVLLELRALEHEVVGQDRAAGIRNLLARLLERPSRKPGDLRALLLEEREH